MSTDDKLRVHIAEVYGDDPRLCNCLEGAGIHTMGDLLNKTQAQLMAIPVLGPASLAKILKRARTWVGR